MRCARIALQILGESAKRAGASAETKLDRLDLVQCLGQRHPGRPV